MNDNQWDKSLFRKEVEEQVEKITKELLKVENMANDIMVKAEVVSYQVKCLKKYIDNWSTIRIENNCQWNKSMWPDKGCKSDNSLVMLCSGHCEMKLVK